MLEHIIGVSIRRRWLVLVATLAVAALGIVNYQRLPIDAVSFTPLFRSVPSTTSIPGAPLSLSTMETFFTSSSPPGRTRNVFELIANTPPPLMSILSVPKRSTLRAIVLFSVPLIVAVTPARMVVVPVPVIAPEIQSRLDVIVRFPAPLMVPPKPRSARFGTEMSVFKMSPPFVLSNKPAPVNVTTDMIVKLITPHVGNPVVKDALGAAMLAMGIGALPEALPHQYPELYQRFEAIIAAQGGGAAPPAALSIV